MRVYLARDIPACVMYCVNGESGSFLLIESTDSMIPYGTIISMLQLISLPTKVIDMKIFTKL